VGGRPDDGGARRVHHPIDVRTQALLHHEPRARHVDIDHELAVLPAHRGHAGAVENPFHARDGAAHRAAVAHLEPEPPEIEARDRGVRGALLDAERDLVAAVGQQMRHM
jgi:hypothetical protein